MSVPLIIAVTGHRDIVDSEIPLLKSRTREFFEDLRKEFSGLPLLVLSAMAEGADQLVAEVALEQEIPVYAVLPMPEEHYQQDFSAESLGPYQLLRRQSELVELPLLTDESDINRDKQYVALAGYLAAHCHVLLALWDGEETHVPGGTSAVIRLHQHDTMSQQNNAQPINPIDFIEDESDLVYHITCSRKSESPQRDAGASAWLTRDDVTPRTALMPERYNVVFNRMIEYNEDLERLSPSIVPALIQDDRQPPERLSDVGVAFAAADSMAGHYQLRMYAALRIGYSLALIAGLSFIVYADLMSSPLILYTYLTAMILVLVVFQLESYRGWQRKYLDYRVLAEALRVQFYWQLAGVRMDNPFHYAHDRFHDRRDLQLGWIRHVMRFASIKSDSRLDESTPEDVDLVVQSWVRDEKFGQVSYFKSKAAEREKRIRQMEMLEGLGLLTVLTVAITLLFWPGELFASDFLIALVGFVPFGIAVRQNFAHRVAERELVAQYQYFFRIFSSADELLKRSVRIDTQRNIIKALGEAALDESSQWILRHRERPVSTNGVMG